MEAKRVLVYAAALTIFLKMFNVNSIIEFLARTADVKY